LIHVYGTSHVSEESFKVIDDALEKHDPAVVALELDHPRLNSLLSDQDQESGPVFARLIRYFQDKIGSRTGVMPGEEMIYAYESALDRGKDVALVDQDIRVTLQRLKGVRRKEKVKAGFSILVGFLGFGDKIDVSRIPEDEMIQELVGEMEDEFPGLYRVLMEERNRFIVEALQQVDEENEGDVVAFLGAAHVEKVEEMLNEVSSQGSMEPKQSRLEG
jgi:pheromone shutdown protein TraB